MRYADDCNVYVQSKRAAERVMEGLVVLYAKLTLRVNPTKSAVAPAWERSILGYRFWVAPGKIVQRRVSPKALEAMKERVREITSRSGGRSLVQVVARLRSYLVGWKRTSVSPTRPASWPGWTNGYIVDCGCSCSNNGSGLERCIPTRRRSFRTCP